MSELFDDVWEGRDEVVVDDVNHDLTLYVGYHRCLYIVVLLMGRKPQITLFVISTAGFGQRISWRDDIPRPAGYQMTFKVRSHRGEEDVLQLISLCASRKSYTTWHLVYSSRS